MEERTRFKSLAADLGLTSGRWSKTQGGRRDWLGMTLLPLQCWAAEWGLPEAVKCQNASAPDSAAGDLGARERKVDSNFSPLRTEKRLMVF